MRRTTLLLCHLLLAPVSAQLQWRLVTPATSPSPRSAPVLVFDGVGLLLFGGFTASGHSGETWRFDGSNWMLLRPQDSPPARSWPAVAYEAARRRVLLFGGRNDTTVFNDLWEWDGQTWRPLFPAWRPSRLYWPRMAYDPLWQRTVLYGSTDEYGNAGLYQTWDWNGTVWIERSPSFGPRATQVALAYDTVSLRPLLFTTSNPYSFGTTWSYAGSLWWLLLPSVQPPPRWFGNMASDDGRQRIVLFGGQGAVAPLSDTWEWDGTTWQPRTLPTPPPARSQHAISYDPIRRRIVVFGGASGTSRLNDTWELYDPNASIGTFTTYGNGCPGSAGVPRLDVASPGMLPYLGESFSLRLASLPPTNLPFLFLGASKTTWNGVPLPLDLTFFGAPGCSLLASPDLAVRLVNTGGVATLTFVIPDDPSLLGVRFFQQGWILDAAANRVGIAVSNGGDALVGRR